MGSVLRCVLAVSACFGLGWSDATAQSTDEDALKALFIYKFTDYVTWPAHGERFTICSTNDDKVTGTLREIAARERVDGRPLEITVINPEAGTAVNCDLLWVGQDGTTGLPRAIAGWGGDGVLVVSDRPDAANKGAAIGLVTEAGRVRFEVDRPALRTSKLQASSQLLKLARTVR